MRRILSRSNVLAVAVVAFVNFSSVFAADPEADDGKPALELRTRSLIDLGRTLSYLLKSSGNRAQSEQIANLVAVFEKEKEGFEGIELNKPIGVYVIVAQDVAESPVVVMLPIANEDKFLGLLENKANLKAKRQDGGVYLLEVPNFPFPIHFRFAHGYIYATIRSEKGIAPAKLLKPAAFFAQEAKVAVDVNLDLTRIPEDIRKAAYGQIELQLTEAAKNAGGDEIEKLARGTLVETAAEAAKLVLMEAKQLSVKADVVPKNDDISVELVLTPQSGSTLAKTLSSWGDRPSLPASIAEVKSPIVGVGVNFQLPKLATQRLTKLFEAATEKALDDKAGDEKDLLEAAFKSFAPTVKAGDLQLGVAFTQGKDQGKYGLVSGVAYKDTPQLIKLMKRIADLVPGNIVGFEFDKEKAHGFDWHRIELPDQFETDTHGFLSKMGWFATKDDLYLTAFGPTADPLKAIAVRKELPDSKMLNLEFSISRLVLANRIANGLEDDEKLVRDLIRKSFGEAGPIGKDTLRLTGAAGKTLTLRFDIKGKSLPFFDIKNAAIEK